MEFFKELALSCHSQPLGKKVHNENLIITLSSLASPHISSFFFNTIHDYVYSSSYFPNLYRHATFSSPATYSKTRSTRPSVKSRSRFRSAKPSNLHSRNTGTRFPSISRRESRNCGSSRPIWCFTDMISSWRGSKPSW